MASDSSGPKAASDAGAAGGCGVVAQSDSAVMKVVRCHLEGRDRYFHEYIADDFAHQGPEWRVTLLPAVMFEGSLAEKIADQLRQYGWSAVALEVVTVTGPRGGVHLETKA
jgi:hypothetical protein